MMGVIKIEIRKILVPEGRMRPVNPAWVEKLRESIQKGGLLQFPVVGKPNADGMWLLVDGAHRLAALKQLKYRSVSCLPIEGDKDVRRLAEIESNLLRAPLTAAERLEHLAERRILEEHLGFKHGHGGDRKSKDFQVANDGNLKSSGKNFQLENRILSDAQAEEIGISDRTIRNAARFCKRLSAEERNRIKGTAVQNRYKDLFAIAAIADIQQRTAVIDALSDAEKPAPSLYEAKYRAGLVQPPERDLKKEADLKVFREVDLLFRTLFYGWDDVLDRFVAEVADQKPDFLDIVTELVKRIKLRDREIPEDGVGES